MAELDRTFNVFARRESQVYFDFAYAQLYRGDLAGAKSTFERGLRLHPSNFDGQIRLAELEVRSGRPQPALERLQFVASRSTDEDQRAYARQLIETHDLEAQRTTLVLPDRFDHRLLMVPIDLVPEALLEAVRSRIEQEFRIRVEIVDGIPLPETLPSRDFLDRLLTEVVAHIEESNSPDELAWFYTFLGLPASGPRTREERERVVLALLNAQEDGAAIWRDWRWRYTVAVDGKALLDHLRSELQAELEEPKTLGVLAITAHDVYNGESGPLFALTPKGAGVIPYVRFFRPQDSYETGLHRTIVQSLSSVVMILGVERATVQHCASAYANSYEEFDQKQDRLCAETLERLIEKYASF
ncbi:hypothetical protein LIP_0497 [Limnochorda pilosa]|uniref:Uncharacterized protein n=1 Tax=Limnochorda pilosa TaxID=1555112 RepID=A0A0K2SHP6_LIMPI|nr:hypothetical protein LIP_0497 [Limnochorda pilosa]